MEYIKKFEAITKKVLDELKDSDRTYLEQRLHQNVKRTDDFRNISNNLINLIRQHYFWLS